MIILVSVRELHRWWWGLIGQDHLYNLHKAKKWWLSQCRCHNFTFSQFHFSHPIHPPAARWYYIRLWNILMIQQKWWGGWRLNQCFKSKLEICYFGNSCSDSLQLPNYSFLRNRLCQTWKAEIIQRDYDGDDDRWLVVVEARFDSSFSNRNQNWWSLFLTNINIHTIWK